MKTINYLSNTNSKLRKNNIFTFGIPAGYSAAGIKTCPNAGECLKGCYARQGFYVMPNVAKKQEERLELFLETPGLFILTISEEIKRRKVKRMRIHESGDFFSVEYTNCWLEIIRRNPKTKFYAYTKMVRFFKAREALLPTNFHVIYSEGGTQDHSINRESDKHSRVFSSEKEMRESGYADNFRSDYAALIGKQKIGLVYHGNPSKKWSTA